MSFGQILFILFLISLNAFFVGVEFAIIAGRRSRLDLLVTADNHAAQIVRKWMENEKDRDRLIGASQLGITLVSLALGAAGEDVFEALLAPFFTHFVLPENLSFLSSLTSGLPLIISLTVVTAAQIVLGEQVPKVAVLRSPERFALFAAPFMNIFITVFRGFIVLLDGATRLVLKFFGLPAHENTHTSVISAEELKQIVSGPEVDGVIEPTEREMISAVINFGSLVVRQVMVPRVEIIALEANTPITEALQIAAKHGITKLPVYEENLDHIIGVLHLKDLLPVLQENHLDTRLAREMAREGLFVPETVSVNDLLRQMRARRQHMAITLDEFGGTAGLVTLEDLMEEIVGEFQDSFDEDLPAVQILPDGSALVDGMSMIEEINQKFSINLFDPNYDTIAGYVLGKLGRIAQVGDMVEDTEQGVRLKVDLMDRMRIARIHFSRL